MANPLKLPMVRRSLRNLVSPPATRRYPTEVRPPFPGARGTLEFDLETCVLCGLCVRRCPTVALTCERDESCSRSSSSAASPAACASMSATSTACSLSAEPTPGAHQRRDRRRRRRPGYEEWHKPDPEPEPATMAVAAGSRIDRPRAGLTRPAQHEEPSMANAILASECISCAACEPECPNGAISVDG